MMKTYVSLSRFALGCIALCWNGTGWAAAEGAGSTFRLSGSVRLRHEIIDGQARAGFDAEDSLTNIRTQLLAEYQADGWRLGAELFDSRAWGADPGTPISTNEVNTVELVQAYAAREWKDPFGRGSSLGVTLGRMTLNLGSRRLVAADDYRNTTNGYTGIRTDLAAAKGWKATFIYTLPQMRRPDDAEGMRDHKVRLDKESLDLVLWGGLVSKAKALGPVMAEVSYFHLGERDAPGRPTRDRSLNTFGGRIMTDPAPGRIDYEVEAFYQWGGINASLALTAVRQDVSASFVHADVGYSLADKWKTRFSVEFDRASGDRSGGSYGRFDTLLGMRRADFAPAGLYNAITRANIVTPGVRVEASPDKRLDWFLSYRAMWLDSATDGFATTGVRDASGRSGKFVGHQVEGRIRYWLIPSRLRFEYDGLLLAKGRFLRDAPNAPPKAWTVYNSFNLTASF
jgi:hypothetical protein